MIFLKKDMRISNNDTVWSIRKERSEEIKINALDLENCPITFTLNPL